MLRHIPFGFTLVLLSLSCNPTKTAFQEQPTRSSEHNAIRSASMRSTYTDDIGIILNDNKPLHHNFMLKNTTSHAIRIGPGVTLNPCCSTIDTIAKELQPGEETAIGVILKGARASDRKKVEFHVSTNHKDLSALTFTLIYDGRPTWEVQAVENRPMSTAVGSSISKEFDIITRQEGENGFREPDTISITSPFVCRTINTIQADDTSLSPIHVRKTRIMIVLPNAESEGSVAGRLQIAWNDGAQKQFPITCQITSLIQMHPRSIVIKANPDVTTHVIVLNAEVDEFKIQKVSGLLMTGCSIANNPSWTRSAKTHSLTITLDSRLRKENATSDIYILTDHPKQKQVVVKVTAIPRISGVE